MHFYLNFGKNSREIMERCGGRIRKKEVFKRLVSWNESINNRARLFEPSSELRTCSPTCFLSVVRRDELCQACQQPANTRAINRASPNF